MTLIKKLKYIYKAEHIHFLSIDRKTYFKWKWLIVLTVKLNKKYKSCEIFRKKHKGMENFVVIALKYSGKNIKRRTMGFAKDFVNTNRKAKCIYCETKLTLENATTDHIVPISQGSNNAQVNLIICCGDCNAERGVTPFYEYLRHKNPRYTKIKHIFV